jgi:hypothetical protein
MRNSIRWLLGGLVACIIMAGPALAAPRISGRIVKIVPARRMVVLQRSDGKTFHAIIENGATVERLGAATNLSGFRVGDYVVVEVAGPLNDDPLDCDGLYDVHTAGRAPAPTGSVDTSIQGGTAVMGGSAARMPFDYNNSSTAAAVSGSSANVSHVQWEPAYTPTRPWDGITGDPNHALPPPVVHPVPATLESKAPGTAQNTQPTVGAYGPVVPTTFPAPAQGGTYTTQPSPAANPWIAQAVGQNNPPVPQSPVSTVRTMPQMPSPTQMYGVDDNNAVGIANAARPGMDIVSLQGSVTQIMAPQRMFTMQAMVQGRQVMVNVRVPVQVGVMSSRTQAMVGLENVRIGDYVMLTGIQMMPGAVEARKLYVNQ